MVFDRLMKGKITFLPATLRIIGLPHSDPTKCADTVSIENPHTYPFFQIEIEHRCQLTPFSVSCDACRKNGFSPGALNFAGNFCSVCGGRGKVSNSSNPKCILFRPDQYNGKTWVWLGRWVEADVPYRSKVWLSKCCGKFVSGLTLYS